MNIFKYRLLLKRLLLALLIYPLVRILFVAFNLELFSNVPFVEMVLAFFYGFRFDLASLLIINTPFILLSILPIGHLFIDHIKKYVFIFGNTFLLGFSVIDFEFYKFNGKRLTLGVLGVASDIADQAFQIGLYYWYYSLFIILIFFFYFYFYPKEKIQSAKRMKTYKVIFLNFIILIITFIGIRGGLQLRSISPKSAFIFDHTASGQVALNSGYTFLRSLGQKSLKPVNYFKDDSEAISIIETEKGISSSRINLGRKNIIILIIESLTQEYIDLGYTPFLSDLSKESVYIDLGFANGRRSIEALPSILTGMPSLLSKPLYQSSFQTNYFKSLPQSLKENGYHTSFFHGGKTGTMDFDAYTKSIGINEYYGKEDYPNQDHYDGNWGIFDHYFIDWFGEKLRGIEPPFFATFFSLSSHQPYSIPIGFKDTFKKGKLEIHESMGYADRSLELFFKKYKNENWFNDSIFIITGDHTQKRETKKYLNSLGQFRIPFIIYSPTGKIDLDTSTLMQQADILPTVLDLLGLSQKERLLYGCSVFSECKPTVFNRIGDEYFLIDLPFVIFSQNDEFKIFRFNDDLSESKIVSNKDHPRLIKLFKAFKQYTINGLIKNKLYF